LNLPSQIWVPGKGVIRYYYDAAGNKLQKRTLDNTVSLTTPSITTYIGGAVYLNDTLQFFGTPEGRVRSNADNTGWLYDYFLKDHLGNIRMMITDDYNVSSPILEAYSYYPFGLQMAGISLQQTGNLQNKYLYNGKELQEDLGLNQYDYGARFYDAQIGRWHILDKLSDKYPNSSPYTYVLDRPTIAIDPDGQRIIFVNGYLGFGSPTGGPTYWNGANGAFVNGAKAFFNDYSTPYFTNVEYSALSSAADRHEDGYAYARDHYYELTEGMDVYGDDNTFEVVTHSMGASFGEGMIDYLKMMGWKVKESVHLNAFQAADIKANTNVNNKPGTDTPDPNGAGTFVIDYQNTNDPVINNWFRSSPGDIKNAKKIREQSPNSLSTRHRTPIDNDNFWNELNGLINQKVNNRQISNILTNWLQQNPNIQVTIQQ
ncbi:RHS repeat domain-containing protein, partial [Arachidicoccus ginsenosidivorans]